MPQSPDVLVVGAGAIGAAIAYEVAGRGRTVIVVDRGAPGGEASGAAAGVLAVASARAEDEPLLERRRASLARFPALAEALAAETGIDVQLDRAGVVEIACTEAEEEAAAARAERRRAQGFRVARWSGAEARAAEPLLHTGVRAAFHYADDARVDPGRLVDALIAGARGRGAEVWPGAPVTAVERTGDRVTAVQAGHRRVTPGTVVLAAGAWAPRVPSLAPELPVEPARGQMFALRPPPAPVRHVLQGNEGYLVPCRNGELLVGATVERAGFERAVTPEGLRELTGRLAGIAPAALAAPIVRAWAGLRPYAPDGPIVRSADGTANLVLACGHYRSGILLAPETAARVADLLG